ANQPGRSRDIEPCNSRHGGPVWFSDWFEPAPACNVDQLGSSRLFARAKSPRAASHIIPSIDPEMASGNIATTNQLPLGRPSLSFTQIRIAYINGIAAANAIAAN